MGRGSRGEGGFFGRWGYNPKSACALVSAVDIDGATVDKPSLDLRQSAHTMCVCVW